MPEQNKAKGRLYAVGVGPGDPELLTLKAARVIGQCPVVAAPRTAGGRMLAWEIARRALPAQQLAGKTLLPLDFAMSTDPARCAAAHAAAADRVEAELAAGRDVAMLNIGDVSLYASCGYLLDALAARGYETGRVAGVPSFCAAAALLNESLTGIDTPVHILPGGAVPLDEALDWPGTKIIMKSARRLPAVIETLRAKGLAGRSSLAANCGLPGQLLLHSLEGDAAAALDAGYFVTVIVKEG